MLLGNEDKARAVEAVQEIITQLEQSTVPDALKFSHVTILNSYIDGLNAFRLDPEAVFVIVDRYNKDVLPSLDGFNAKMKAATDFSNGGKLPPTNLFDKDAPVFSEGLEVDYEDPVVVNLMDRADELRRKIESHVSEGDLSETEAEINYFRHLNAFEDILDPTDGYSFAEQRLAFLETYYDKNKASYHNPYLDPPDLDVNEYTPELAVMASKVLALHQSVLGHINNGVLPLDQAMDDYLPLLNSFPDYIESGESDARAVLEILEQRYQNDFGELPKTPQDEARVLADLVASVDANVPLEFAEALHSAMQRQELGLADVHMDTLSLRFPYVPEILDGKVLVAEKQGQFLSVWKDEDDNYVLMSEGELSDMLQGVILDADDSVAKAGCLNQYGTDLATLYIAEALISLNAANNGTKGFQPVQISEITQEEPRKLEVPPVDGCDFSEPGMK